jgi:HAUS augmin-like complex subunit 1
MDQSIDLLPNALFSPSKAAQQRAQAQEWHQVDAWLSARYQGRSIPQFERNEDTLRALLALSSANERADEERDLLWTAQKDATAELKTAKERGAADEPTALLAGLTKGLTKEGRESLDALAMAAAALDVTRPSELAIAAAIARRTQTVQIIAQQQMYLTQFQKTLEKELQAMRVQLQELRSTAFQPPLSLQRQTLDWTRNTKQLRAKLAEYADRLASLSASQPSSAINDVTELVEQEQRNLQLEENLFSIEAEISAYKGLPSNRDAAVEEVKKMEEETARLERRLDVLFEGLVEKG